MGPESALAQLVLRSFGVCFGPGCFVWKHHSSEYDPAGIPDLVGHLFGVFVGLELKANGSYPTPAQLRVLLQLQKGDCLTGLIVTHLDHYWYVPSYVVAATARKGEVKFSYRSQIGWRKLLLDEYPAPNGTMLPYLRLRIPFEEYLPHDPLLAASS